MYANVYVHTYEKIFLVKLSAILFFFFSSSFTTAIISTKILILNVSNGLAKSFEYYLAAYLTAVFSVHAIEISSVLSRQIFMYGLLTWHELNCVSLSIGEIVYGARRIVTSCSR